MGMFDKYLGAAAEESTTVPAAVAVASPDDSAALSLSDETKKSLQRELASVHKASNAEKAEANNRAIAEMFQNIGTAYVNQNGKLVVPTVVGGRYGALLLESQAADDIIQAKCAERGLTIGKDKRTSEKEKLRGSALLAGARIKTFIRVAQNDGVYCLDLADGNMVVTKPGKWSVEQNTGIPFMLVGAPLPTPKKPDSLEAGYTFICDFLARAGVPRRMHLIVVAVLLEWLRPDTAHPLLDIVGPSGGGKTTLVIMLINLIDPSSDWKIGEVPGLTEAEMVAAANNSYVQFLDNKGVLSVESQNLGCRMVYGTVVMQRKYYAQTEVEQTEVHCPLAITSINPSITAPDLLARAVRIPFKQRSGGYISETEIRSKYYEERPRLLGALLELFAAALDILPQVRKQRQWRHRLVDFAQMGESLAQVVGLEAGAFVAELDAMRHGVASDIAEGDKFVTNVVEFVRAKGRHAQPAERLPAFKSWAEKPGWVAIERNGQVIVAVRAATLLKETKPLSYPENKDFPENARAMTSRLNIKLPLLADLGISALNEPNLGGQKNGAWVFTYRESVDA